MSTRMAPKILVPLLLTIASSLAGAACVPVVGTVRLTPDFACTINQPGVAEGAAAGLFSAQLGECFSVKLNLAGFPAATGYAGLTNEYLAGAAGMTQTPAAIPQGAMDPRPRQIVQTARSAITLGSGSRKTTIYSTDVIVTLPVLAPTGQVVGAKTMTEQLVISGTDKQGAFANVTGVLHVIGSSLGQAAPVVGQICMP